ncbi:MAG: hypothetical protein ABL984_13200 [Pyrinomonadaceae bacterium]
MRRKRIVQRLTISSLILTAFIVGAQISAFGQEAGGAKVARLLNESGVKLTKVGDDIWTIPFEGKSMKEISVVTTVSEGIFLAFALIPESKNVKFPPPALQKLLNLNDEFDRVKIGIDDKGFVFVRIDMTVRTLDKQELSDGIDQVAAAVDQVYGHIRPHLPKTK